MPDSPHIPTWLIAGYPSTLSSKTANDREHLDTLPIAKNPARREARRIYFNATVF
jgi:hypothetical protein